LELANKKRAVVASGHPLVAEAAAEILTIGGNAYDAAIAAGFAGAVVEPTLTSLGGGGFLLSKTLEGEEILFDFFVDTPGKGRPETDLEPHFFPVTIHFPASEQTFNVGLGSVAVPGNLKGFLHVHSRLGSLRLKEILAPAIKLAQKGVELNAHQAYFNKLLEPVNTLTEEGKALYAPKGKYISQGELFKNPDIASFLEELPRDQGRDFYEGNLARKIIKDMEEGQGLLTMEDMKSYKVIERKPLEIKFWERRLLTNPAPSLGGPLIAIALNLLDMAGLSKMKWGSPEHLITIGSIMEKVEHMRDQGCHGLDALPSGWLEKTEKIIRTFSRGTTHVSVSDAFGNSASMTTSNGEGSGYMAPGTGIMLNNMMGEDDLHPEGFHACPPGQRVSSMMSPSLLLKNGEVELVFGSGGSKRIRTAMLQVLSNLLDFGMEIKEAVIAPRIHWDGASMQVEPGYKKKSLEAVGKRWPINLWNELNVYFGGVHAVIPGKTGAGDPRRGGETVTVFL
jgi:gamma-glutamyltranspeptidase/glutathione hydrolase